MPFSGWEIPLIVLLALLFFGGKKLPELAKGFGKSIRTFKEEVTKQDDEDEDGFEEVKTKSTQQKKTK